MAKKGIRYCVFAKAAKRESGVGYAYSDLTNPSPVVSFNGNITSYNVKDWGDDRAVDVISGVSGGTLSLELNDDTPELYYYLLGHSFGEASEGDIMAPIIFKDSDVAPIVGVAAIAKESNQPFGLNWIVKIYDAVKFSEPNDENQTRTDSITFGHINLDGKIFFAPGGGWKKEVACISEEAARSVIADYLSTPVSPSSGS